ncbi:MAG TPA: fasciclin domain-containing protein [Ferruginibacter sp.]|nr:fasciclin domain-containing protein [Ferruginibacter sp.]
MKMMHQLRNSFLLLATGLVMTSTMVSCSKDDDPAPVQPNIVDVVNSNANFSLLKQAIDRAGIGSALTGSNLTVFAPDNDAFAASGITSTVINSLTPAQLTDILTYHVVGARVASGSVPVSDTVKTLQGQNIYASRNANGVFVNGVAVKSADVAASNGVIHVISSVLMAPTENIAEIATGEPELSRLVTAVVHAGLLPAIQGPGKFTVFAPTNAAFTAAGFPDDASITAAPSSVVADIVRAHILPTNVFASDLIAGANTPTIQTGVSLLIATTPPSVKINGSANPASNIVVPAGVNIMAKNGVVHLIDRVILP